ncbi:DUF6012 family protein [Pseudomonas aeruginosa]
MVGHSQEVKSVLIHLTPTFMMCRESGRACKVIDLTIPEFNLKLVGGKDIVERRPHANNMHLVVSPKSSRRALVGVLFELAQPVKKFVCTTRWAISAELVAEHVVHYDLADDDYDAATTRMSLWRGSGESPERERRCIEEYSGFSPLQAEPRMWVGAVGIRNSRCSMLIHDSRANVVRREDQFKLPTIQRARLEPENTRWCRQPPFETAWKVG